jgi:prepilin-type processing-associated H-X9-DG protein
VRRSLSNQHGDCDDSAATECLEGESSLGRSGILWCDGSVSAVDSHELARRATRQRCKQGNGTLRAAILEYALDVAKEFLPTYSTY